MLWVKLICLRKRIKEVFCRKSWKQSRQPNGLLSTRAWKQITTQHTWIQRNHNFHKVVTILSTTCIKCKPAENYSSWEHPAHTGLSPQGTRARARRPCTTHGGLCSHHLREGLPWQATAALCTSKPSTRKPLCQAPSTLKSSQTQVYSATGKQLLGHNSDTKCINHLEHTDFKCEYSVLAVKNVHLMTKDIALN